MTTETFYRLIVQKVAGIRLSNHKKWIQQVTNHKVLYVASPVDASGKFF